MIVVVGWRFIEIFIDMFLISSGTFIAVLIFFMIANAFPSWSISLTVGFDDGAFILWMPPFDFYLGNAARFLKYKCQIKLP
jgi:hypothetical protein